jgi:hypothetical protein
VNWLIRLYPRPWRQRYQDEFAGLVADLSAAQPSRFGRLRLAIDVARGVLDAWIHRRQTMNLPEHPMTPAVRRGVFDGLLVSVAAATVLVLSNVVFPRGPDESDNDPEYLVQIAAGYALLFLIFVLIGLHAQRRSDSQWSGAAGGAAAGLVLAFAVMVTSLVIDNAFLSTVSQQHDKRVAFEASGWSSMRAYLTVRTLLGALVVLPGATVVGGLLGALGGLAGRRRRPGVGAAA